MGTSIRSGTVTASAMLKRLSAYPRQNGLAVALRESGRLDRSLYTLRWLLDLDLRDRTFENQAFRAPGLNLVVAAVILWNMRHLQLAAEDRGGGSRRRAGDESELRPLRTRPSLLAA